MKWKTLIASHWNVALVLIQLSLLILMVTFNPLGGDVIDSPVGP